MTNVESEGTHVFQDLAVLVHEQENALDWLDKIQFAALTHWIFLNKNQLADLNSNVRATFCEVSSSLQDDGRRVATRWRQNLSK